MHFDKEPLLGGLPRQYFKCDFGPNEQCLSLFESIADGTEGVAGVVEADKAYIGSKSIDTTFALVFDHGVDVGGTIKQWFSKLREELKRVPQAKRAKLIGEIVHPDPLEASVIHSTTSTYHGADRSD